ALALLVYELAVVEIERRGQLPAQVRDEQREQARARAARAHDDRVVAIDPARLTDRDHHAPDRDAAQVDLILHRLTWDSDELLVEGSCRDYRIGFRLLGQRHGAAGRNEDEREPHAS